MIPPQWCVAGGRLSPSGADMKMCCGGAADEGGGESVAPEKQNTKNYENVQLKMRKIT